VSSRIEQLKWLPAEMQFKMPSVVDELMVYNN
jgi:hypothetical protein